MDELKLSLLQADKDDVFEVLRSLSDIPDTIEALNQQGISLTLELCKKGFTDVLEYLVAQDIDIFNGSFDESLVNVACRYHQVDVLQYLLSRGVPILLKNVQVWHEESPFYIATKLGYLDVLLMLIEHSPALIKDEAVRYCLLYAACLGGSLDTLRLWLSPGVDVNIPLQLIQSLDDCETKSPLYAACSGGHAHVIEFLRHNCLGLHLTESVCNKYPDVIGDIVKQFFFPIDKPSTKATDDVDDDDDLFELCRGQLQNKNLYMLHTSWLLPYSVTLVVLDISDNSIRELPSCLPWNFQNLRLFFAMRNQLKTLAPPKEMLDDEFCPRLEEVNLSFNNLETVSRDLFQVSTLKNLNLSHNKLPYLTKSMHQRGIDQADHESILHRQRSYTKPWLFPQLLKLDLSHNCLQMLPGEITGCTALLELNVKHNDLTTFPQPWNCPMTTLDLSNNRLERFPVNTEQYWCSSLKYLNISDNLLDEINEGVVKLSVLTDLNASNNKIERLPAPDVWECGHLNQLNLKHNKLGSLKEVSPGKSPKMFKAFSLNKIKKINRLSLTSAEEPSRLVQFPELLASCLRELRLADNNLDSVPSSIFDLKMIEVLDLSYNAQIKSLPKGLGKLKNCGMLKLKGLSLDNVPSDFVSGRNNKTRDILSGFLESLRDSKPYYKMKTVVLGKKDKGKTTLVNILANRKQTAMNRSSIVREEVHLVKRKASFTSPFTSSEKHPEIKLTMWDISGAESYSLIQHSVFTPHSLYILVWDFWSIGQELDKIGQWLYNIQAISPFFKIILVGTFVDKMTLKMEEKEQIQRDLQKKIDSKFTNIQGGICLCPVSCVNKEGIDDLKTVMYNTALSMKLPGRRGQLYIGRKIPNSYLRVESLMVEEVQHLVSINEPPFLTQTQFNEIIEKHLSGVEDDLLNQEEITAVIKFLVETGTLLHFSDQLGALNTLYFLDPAWFCDVLVHVLISEEGKRLLTLGRGQISIRDVERIYKEDDRFPDQFINQYIELLERFEIAITVTQSNKLFFPCHLPILPPMMNPHQDTDAREIRRLYRMAECPSGFWMRLLSRMMTRVEQFTSSEWFHKPAMTQSMRRMERTTIRRPSQHKVNRGNSYKGLHIKNPTKTFSREWIHIQHEKGNFCVEPVTCTGTETNNHLQKGVLITEVNKTEDFGIMGIIVDEIEDIIQDYYPGLLEPDEMTMQSQLERYALCSTCYQGDLSSSDINHFTMEHCARMLVHGNTITCPRGVKHELQSLVPDLLMKDLPDKFLLEMTHLELQENQENFLGGGVTGSVFKGMYKGEAIAIKVYRSDIRNKPGDVYFGTNVIHSNSSDSGTATMSTQGSIGDQRLKKDEEYVNFAKGPRIDLDEAESIKALKALREMRQEVALTSRLQHPCIVSLIGIAFTPKLMMALELAPLGSLRSALDKRLGDRAVFNKYRDKDKVFQPLFDKELTFKLVYQIAKGLAYLHTNGIIYKDLKSDNILTMSLDPASPVNVKLSDYGISKYCWSGRSVGLVGTPGYQAPEILDGLAYDEKVDIFAFSMVIYEILSGRRPYSEYENMAQITKALIAEAKRPNVKEFNVQTKFPYLENLMAQCWEKQAIDRPSAVNIVRQMNKVQFLAQSASFKMDDNYTFSSDSVFGASDDDNQSGLLWIWEGSGSSRCLTILDVEKVSCRVQKEIFEGPRVLCMAIVDKHAWVGTEAMEIEVFGTEQVGHLSQIHKVQLDARPVQIVAVQQQQGHGQKMHFVYVALNNARVHLYQSRPPQADFVERRRKTVKKMQGFSDEKTVVLRSETSYCMTLTNKKTELWVSSSGHIDIINCEDFKVLLGDRINLTILNLLCGIKQCLNVCQMRNTGSQVFGLLENSPYILVFCETKNCCMSVLDLGAKNVSTAMVSRQLNFTKDDHKEYHGVKNDRKESTDDEGHETLDGGKYDKLFCASKKDDAKAENPEVPSVPPRIRRRKMPPRPVTSIIPGEDTSPEPPPVVRPHPFFRSIQQNAVEEMEQLSQSDDDYPSQLPVVPPRLGLSLSPVRPVKPNLVPKSSFSLPARHLTGEYDITVTSIEIIEQTLWTGRSHGDICVVDMKQPLEKQSKQNFGKVVTVMYDLCHKYRGRQVEEGVKLVKTGKCIASACTLECDEKSMMEIASWECYDADDISRLNEYWSTLMNIEKNLISVEKSSTVAQDLPEQF